MFVGRVEDPLPYYAAADCYVHPTYYDPCSLVVLEAAACGLPLVTSCYNGASELFRDGEDMLLVDDPADDAALADAMRTLFGAPARRRLGEAARAAILQHSFNRNVDQILEIYNEILQRPRRLAAWLRGPAGPRRRRRPARRQPAQRADTRHYWGRSEAMRIGLVIDHLDPRRGGAEQWTYQHAERLLARGHEVHVVAQGVSGPAARLDIVPHLFGPARSVLHRAAAAEAVLEDLSLDVIHDIGLGWRSDVLQSEDGSRMAQWEQKLLLLPAWQRPWKRAMLQVLPRYRDFRRLMARQYGDPRRTVIAVSRMCARDYQHYHDVPPERIRLVYHGADTERFSPAQRGRWREEIRDRLGICEDEIVLVFVGHDYLRKGLATAVLAANRLAAEGRPGPLAGGGRKEAAAALARRRVAPGSGRQRRRYRRSGPLLRRRRRLRAADLLRSVQPERLGGGGQRAAERHQPLQRRGGTAHRGRRRQRDRRPGRRRGIGQCPSPLAGRRRPPADGQGRAEAGPETYAGRQLRPDRVNLPADERGVSSGGVSSSENSVMRICLYTNTALPKLGGQEIVVDALARQFLALGHEPVVLAPWRGSQGPFDPACVPYTTVWHPRFLSTRWLVSWYGRWMAKVQRVYDIDVVHCQGTYPAGYVAARCKAVRHLPLVITSHGDDLAPQGLYDRKPRLRNRYHLALEGADAVVAISAYTAQMFRDASVDPRRIVSIPNGVEVEQFAAPRRGPRSFRPRSGRSPTCSFSAVSSGGKASTCCWRR